MNETLTNNISHSAELQKLYDAANGTYPTDQAKDGSQTLRLGEIYYHSKYNPIREAASTADMVLKDKTNLDVLIAYGCGLGYVAQELYKRLIRDNPAKIKPYLLIVEPNVKMFATALTCTDWTQMIGDENVKFFIAADKSVIGSFLQTIPTKMISYYYHRPTYVSYMDYFKQLQNHISYVLDRKDMNTATIQRFQRLWTRNSIKNLPYINQVNYLSSLHNCAAECNAFVIGGGPSLEKCLPRIRQYQENAIIIAVDTAYQYLKKNGIRTDIIVTVDPQYYNYKYLENIKVENEIIVTDSSIYYKVFDLTEPKRYFVGNSIFPLNQYFENNHERGTLAAGGSVANSAFDVARLIGAANIYLFGIDLSYIDRKTHFKGAFFETSFLSESNYFQTAEHSVYKYLTHCPLIPTVSTTNGIVDTDSKMMIFKKWFDREVPLSHGKVYQPNLGGAKIEGTVIIDFDKTAIAGYDKTPFLQKISALTEKSDKPDTQTTEKIATFIKNAQTIADIYGKIVAKIDEQGNVTPKNAAEIAKQEQHIAAHPELSTAAGVISSSAQDVLALITENVRLSDDETKSAWLKTKKLYQAIVELSDFYTENIKKTLKLHTHSTTI
ncbi:MAG: motility associated factor glycosyltransferase family protein [Spirochaetales bacterium]|nr:motility associated factor glycosyltransferase family protein [Spirochaetales bacterium]